MINWLVLLFNLFCCCCESHIKDKKTTKEKSNPQQQHSIDCFFIPTAAVSPCATKSPFLCWPMRRAWHFTVPHDYFNPQQRRRQVYNVTTVDLVVTALPPHFTQTKNNKDKVHRSASNDKVFFIHLTSTPVKETSILAVRKKKRDVGWSLKSLLCVCVFIDLTNFPLFFLDSLLDPTLSLFQCLIHNFFLSRKL